ncbi:MAG: DUF6807 family protein [Phycisphaeraceae bacterium]
MKSLVIASAALLCALYSAVSLADEQQALVIKAADGRSTVMIGDDVFVGYNESSATSSKPFLYPIIGPTGASMTRHYPMRRDVAGEASDHPHHTSLWFAHGKVNGLDFWHGKNNEYVSHNESSVQTNPNPRPIIVSRDSWSSLDDGTVAEASTEYAFEVLDDGSRVIDYSTSIKPAKGIEQLVFGDTKEGTMAIRLHPALRLKGKVATGHCINSEGHKDNDAWGKRAKWVAYWGVIDGKTCGVAVFDHPTNLRHPTWWHARDYGLVAANPFGISDFERGKHKRGAGDYTLRQGETLDLRYRFVFFAGTAEEAEIAQKYERWVEQTAETDEQAAGWVPLFNGEDLAGWDARPGGEWKVADGAIVGTSPASEKRHGLLVSDHAYKDFEARLKFKVTAGNSGFYFRSMPMDNNVGIKGFQAEIDRTAATGGLYETLGRAWVTKPDRATVNKFYKPGEWADMKVRAVGGHITVWVNGQQVTELQDDPGATEGHFALQLHGGQAMDVAFKDIAVREIK